MSEGVGEASPPVALGDAAPRTPELRDAETLLGAGAPVAGWMQVSRPQGVVPMRPPAALDLCPATQALPGVALAQSARRRHDADWVAGFRGLLLGGRDFSTWLPDGRTAIRSSVPVLAVDGLPEPLPARRRALDAPAIRVGTNNHANYFHWHANVLPNLMAARERGIADLTLLFRHEPPSDWQRASLRLAGFDPEAGVVVGPRETLSVREMVLGSAEGRHLRRASSFVLECAAEVAGRARARAEGPAPERVYIARTDATRRRCLNEAQLIEALEARGFHTMVPSHLGYEGQIITMRAARVVVALHGAGLTNMIFAPGDATVVEIFPSAYFNAVYFAFAQLTGQRYMAFAHSPYASEARKRGQPEEFSLDLERFLGFLDAAGV